MSIFYPNQATPEELADPKFSEAGRVHDWRNHVGERTKKMWKLLTEKQRLAIALDAEDRALMEHWN